MLAQVRTIGYTSISMAWDLDVKSMFFIICLRILVVRALERYSKDPVGALVEIDVFHINKKVASSLRTPFQVAPEGVLT